MSDVKCPMCGKPNPADAEVCEYCQARLKPLIVGDSVSSDPADLLAGLRLTGEINSADADAPEPEASEVDSTDWLARIRARHQAETPAPTEETPIGGEETVSDWLAGLRQEPEEPASEDDALSRLFSEAAPAAPESEPATPSSETISSGGEPFNELTPQTPLTGSEDDLGWLNAFQAVGSADSEKTSEEPTAETPSGSIEAEPAADLDWLADFGTREQPVSEAKSDDDLGWLSAFQGEDLTGSGTPPLEPVADVPFTPIESATEPTTDFGLGADLSSGEKPAAEAGSDDDLGWLSAFQAEGPTGSEIPPIEPVAESPLEVVESISEPAPNFGFQADLGSNELNTAEARQDDDLEWLAALQAEQFAAPVEPVVEPAAESPAEPVTDFGWLADLNAVGTQDGTDAVIRGSIPLDEESTEILQPAPDALPDWLVQLQGTPATGVLSEPLQPAQPEQPDWLRSLSGETDDSETPSGPFTIPVAEEPGIPIPDSNALAIPGQEIPDWLTSLPSEQPANLPMTAAFLPEDQLSSSVPESTAAMFGGQELPEWIGQEESVEKPAEAEEVPTEELEPAQLPTWLQTMRPVEAVAPVAPTSDVDDNRVEKVGPLAGLRGLVNGSETVTQYRKPPVYSIKLQVTERQRLHANLLENVLNTETQPAPPAKESAFSSQRILRGLVTLLLLAALLVPLILQWQSFIPSRNSNQLDVFTESLNQINSGDAILVAVEYDPGLAAELEEAAAGPLQILSEKNATITLISTSPTGPALGEALISQAPGWKDIYIGSSANLGYIAGGSTAVAQLASSSLAGHVILNNLTRSPLRLPKDWPIQQNLRDYQAIILLTDNVETGRAWVEQISPALGETPLLIISSAQSAPVLQAYTGAQVQSLISGSTQASSSRTAAFQIGMLLTALLILIGGVVQGVFLLVSRSKKPREE